MTKNLDGHVRIGDREKSLMAQWRVGFTRVFRVGFDTIRLWRQANTLPTCVYLCNTGEEPAAPCSASLPAPKPIAHVCPCLACPIRTALGHGAAAAADKIEADPGSSEHKLSKEKISGLEAGNSYAVIGVKSGISNGAIAK